MFDDLKIAKDICIALVDEFLNDVIIEIYE